MNAPPIALETSPSRVVEQAAEWRLLGLLFECPSAAWREQVAALAREVSDTELRAAAEQALEEASEGLHHAIFGPGGPVPAREVSYQNSVQSGYLLSELACYYDAFAYRPAIPEATDHISVEVGFVGYLRLKEAYALACQDAEHAAVTSEAGQRFVEDHLAAMAESLATALRSCGIRYLSLAGAVLLRRVGSVRKAVLPVSCEAEPPSEGCLFECSGS